VLAATVRVTRDLDLAEECVQDAYAQALAAWPAAGVPSKPGAWLTTVARRRALDLLRRDTVLRRAVPLLVEDDVAPSYEPSDAIPDDRLRLICTCCHPALSPEAQVALTLRLICGLSTAEVARAFLGERVDDGRPHHPGEEEDRRGTHPVPCSVGGRVA